MKTYYLIEMKYFTSVVFKLLEAETAAAILQNSKNYYSYTLGDKVSLKVVAIFPSLSADAADYICGILEGREKDEENR